MSRPILEGPAAIGTNMLASTSKRPTSTDMSMRAVTSAKESARNDAKAAQSCAMHCPNNFKTSANLANGVPSRMFPTKIWWRLAWQQSPSSGAAAQLSANSTSKSSCNAAQSHGSWNNALKTLARTDDAKSFCAFSSARMSATP